MTRIYPDYVYGAGPRTGCWWDETVSKQSRRAIVGEASVDVAIIGAGFTGLSAALHLAQDGVSVAVLEAETTGWGASGRNGGFCCLGGSMQSDASLDRDFGVSGRIEFRQAEKAAVECVEALLSAHDIDVDRHSQGETELAHRPKDMTALRAKARRINENYGVEPIIFGPEDLAGLGMNGPFFGGLTIPIGFALNPAKFAAGLAGAAEKAGASIFERSPVINMERLPRGHRLVTPSGNITARHVVIATNGYSSEELPPELAGRYLPSQSNVLVTRPLANDEIMAQGWSSDQMAFDSRNLLHYFRLMPDRRFLFGMRGGLLSSPPAEGRARARVLRDFKRMFPAWADVDVPHNWSGMVCLSRRKLPFVGEIDRKSGLWAGLCYHGNGVAMGTHSGALLAQLIQGKAPANYPPASQSFLQRFPLGAARRALLPAAYAYYGLADY